VHQPARKTAHRATALSPTPVAVRWWSRLPTRTPCPKARVSSWCRLPCHAIFDRNKAINLEPVRSRARTEVPDNLTPFHCWASALEVPDADFRHHAPEYLCPKIINRSPWMASRRRISRDRQLRRSREPRSERAGRWIVRWSRALLWSDLS